MEQKALWIIYVNPEYPKCGDMFTAVKTTPRLLEKDIAFVNRKLFNQQFLAKAPQGVVEEEREKAGHLQGRREKLEESLRKIKEALGGQ